jgi:hypothetical protein
MARTSRKFEVGSNTDENSDKSTPEAYSLPRHTVFLRSSVSSDLSKSSKLDRDTHTNTRFHEDARAGKDASESEDSGSGVDSGLDHSASSNKNIKPWPQKSSLNTQEGDAKSRQHSENCDRLEDTSFCCNGNLKCPSRQIATRSSNNSEQKVVSQEAIMPEPTVSMGTLLAGEDNTHEDFQAKVELLIEVTEVVKGTLKNIQPRLELLKAHKRGLLTNQARRQ